MYELVKSLSCTPENNVTLYLNYTQLKKKESKPLMRKKNIQVIHVKKKSYKFYDPAIALPGTHQHKCIPMFTQGQVHKFSRLFTTAPNWETNQMPINKKGINIKYVTVT